MTSKEEKEIFLKCMNLADLDIPHPDLSNVKELLKQKREQRIRRMQNGEQSCNIIEIVDYDCDAKLINELIYSGNMPNVRFTDPAYTVAFKKRYHARIRELFGEDYYSYVLHDYGDKYVCNLLIQDAIKTGKWKELPDVLQEEYHKRVGDVM